MIATTIESESLAEVLHRIGDVPLDRILARPAPGDATPADVLRLCDGEPKRLCELVDGVLVEKAMGQHESRIAIELAGLLWTYLKTHNLGILTGADGPYSLEEDQIRFPDVAFISWDNIPPDADPRTPMPDWTISLAVEAISPMKVATYVICGGMTRCFKSMSADEISAASRRAWKAK